MTKIGKITFSDGRIYLGEYKGYKDDKYCGRGILTYPDGTRQKGLFEEGVFI